MGTVKSEQAKDLNVERKMTKKIITYGDETAYRSFAGGWRVRIPPEGMDISLL
jgi:hypothetical protein